MWGGAPRPPPRKLPGFSQVRFSTGSHQVSTMVHSGFVQLFIGFCSGLSCPWFAQGSLRLCSNVRTRVHQVRVGVTISGFVSRYSSMLFLPLAELHLRLRWAGSNRPNIAPPAATACSWSAVGASGCCGSASQSMGFEHRWQGASFALALASMCLARCT